MDDQAYKAIQAKALEQLFSGKSLLGKDGAFAPLLKEFLDTALEAEMEEHLNDEKRQLNKNKHNGKRTKTLKTNVGEIRFIRKITKTKGAFTSETALLKLIYFGQHQIMKKWTSPIQNRAL